MTTHDEHSKDSPAPDESRPVLLGMPEAWQAVYDRLREAHALAVMGTQQRPGDTEAQSILMASSAAVRAFRDAYQTASVQAIARQIIGDGTTGQE